MRTISVQEVQTLLDKGMSRKEIRTELNLTVSELHYLFQHPKLKGKKAKKQINITIIDEDIEPNNLEQEINSVTFDEPQEEISSEENSIPYFNN